MPNRLSHETSPYLLQHANNPVDWYPWSPEALGRSRELDRPIFLSIGYAACHWCHVMEHESFENESIAAALNASFVCIKVDREERPDLDQIYMNAVMAMTGRGGWPMSVFLTPDLRPFYGGTYWPPTSRYNMPGFMQIISGVSDAWKSRRDEVLDQAERLTEHVQELCTAGLSNSGAALNNELLRSAALALERAFDREHGGFGSAPKFPHPMDLRVLLRQYQRQPSEALLHVVTHTLNRMAEGGMYDHLGGGFHRYSVDARWLVPHFEKMLYDNALLAVAYLEALLLTGRDEFRRVVTETCDYVLREMTDELGGFYSTQDADSEGVEGKFYVWTPAEIEAILGPELGQRFCAVYDVTPQGNFEHANILNTSNQSVAAWAQHWRREEAELRRELTEGRAKLLAARVKRIPPLLDDKVIVSWNGLMIDALAQAGAALNEPRYLAAASRAAEFILKHMRDADGRLLHVGRLGRSRYAAYLDDYAALAGALVSLYEATFEVRWINEAVGLCERMLGEFADSSEGGFFYTADQHETLIARVKDVQDSSVPSGNALAATVLTRLGKLTGRDDFVQAAERTLNASVEFIRRAPSAAGQMLIAADLWLGPTVEVVVAGDADWQQLLHRRFWPRRVLAQANSAAEQSSLQALVNERPAIDGQPTLYVCEQFACQSPVVGVDAIEKRLADICALRSY